MKPKKPTDAERLAVDCIHCGAMPGEMCRDRNVVQPGDVAKFCLERGRPDITRRKLEKKAAELNARKLAEYGGPGSLFEDVAAAEIVPVTADQLEARKWHAFTFKENDGEAERRLQRAFNWLTVHEVRRVAAELIGREWADALWEYCVRTFKNSEHYYYTTFCHALTKADPISLRYRKEARPEWVHPVYNRPGERMIPDLVFPPAGYAPPLTYPEFSARFKWHTLHVHAPKNLPEYDDGDLFERTIGAISGGTK